MKIDKMKFLFSSILLLSFCVSSSSIYADPVNLKELFKNIQKNAQQPQQTSPQGNAPQQSTPTNSAVAGQPSGNNNFQSRKDESNESVRKQARIRAAIREGTPVEVTAVSDGSSDIKTSKEEELMYALSKSVRSVHPDIGIPTKSIAKTFSEFQKNISNPVYGVIKSFEKTEKENIYNMMGQADPSKNFWSVTVKALVNTKLSPENLKKISQDERIIYTQSIGSTIDQARKIAALNAVEQYHGISLRSQGDLLGGVIPNNSFTQNFLNPNYGVIEKIEVVNEGQLPYMKIFTSSIKIILKDLDVLDKKKFGIIERDIKAAEIKKPKSDLMQKIEAINKKVNEAYTVLEKIFDKKGSSEMVKKDALQEKMGHRFGDNGFQEMVGTTSDRKAIIDQRIKENNTPLNEQQKKEQQQASGMLTVAYVESMQIPFLAILTPEGQQNFELLTGFAADNADSFNLVMTFNDKNGIDNTPMKNAKEEQGF